MKLFLKILKYIGIVLAAVVVLVVLFFAVLTVFEYRPKAEEQVSVTTQLSRQVAPQVRVGQTLKLVSWNVGYGALGDNADFFMDGGTMVKTATKERVNENLSGISEFLEAMHPDFVFLQELDKNSNRSYHIDETEFFRDKFPTFQSAFATNYKVLFVPYPLPPIGSVHSGVMTLSSAGIDNAYRVRLPCPFSWPVRLGNLKRCLLVSRLPIENSDKELVLINLHLEAYDSGEGKIAQTNVLKNIFQEELRKGNYVIAGGDFNQTFSTVDLSKFPVYEGKWMPGIIDVSDFDENVQFAMDDNRPTCRSLDRPYRISEKKDFQFYVIDGFLVSANIRIDSLTTHNIGFVSSDHNPVGLDFTLLPQLTQEANKKLSAWAGSWRLTQLTKDGIAQSIAQADLTFEPGKKTNEFAISGSLGGNVFTGEVLSWEPNKLETLSFGTSKMMVPPELAEFESLYTEQLSHLDAYQVGKYSNQSSVTLELRNYAAGLAAEFSQM